MQLQNLKERLRRIVHSGGGALFGVSRIDELRAGFHGEIKETSENLTTGISIGVPVSNGVLETLVDRPNMLYKAHYQQINHILNDIAFQVSSEINRAGCSSAPIPASRILKWKPMQAHLSHREIAYKAGLGWWGRNNLLVNENYGSQVRLVTVLTDLELEADRPTEQDCGDCYACIDACPAGAISVDRKEFNLKACFEKVSEFARPDNIGNHICGLCLAPCFGKK